MTKISYLSFRNTYHQPYYAFPEGYVGYCGYIAKCVEPCCCDEEYCEVCSIQEKEVEVDLNILTLEYLNNYFTSNPYKEPESHACCYCGYQYDGNAQCNCYEYLDY